MLPKSHLTFQGHVKVAYMKIGSISKTACRRAKRYCDISTLVSLWWWRHYGATAKTDRRAKRMKMSIVWNICTAEIKFASRSRASRPLGLLLELTLASDKLNWTSSNTYIKAMQIKF